MSEGGKIEEVDALPFRVGVVVALGAFHADSEEGAEGVCGVIERHADVARIVVRGAGAGPAVAAGGEEFFGDGSPAAVFADGLAGEFDEGGVGAEVAALKFDLVESQVVVKPVVHVALVALRVVEPVDEFFAFIRGGVGVELLDFRERRDAADSDEGGAPEEGGVVDGGGRAFFRFFKNGADELVEFCRFLRHLRRSDLGSRKPCA